MNEDFQKIKDHFTDVLKTVLNRNEGEWKSLYKENE